MHVPIETAREARDEARRLDADCAIAIGGGSTTGLGKAIALESGLPILAIPTTYAGSEMTPIYGLTEGGVKKTGRDARVLPKTVIYDPELTLTLPVGLSITSGLNAIAHAAEGLYAQDAQSDHRVDGRGGHSRGRAGAAVLSRNPHDLAARARRAVWRLAVRRRARPCGDGLAPQAVPHAGRQLQPAACRDAHRRAAACAGLQRGRRAAGDGAHRTRACRSSPRPRPAAAVRLVAVARCTDRAASDRHASRRARPCGRSRGAEPRIPTRGRSSARRCALLLQRAFDGAAPATPASRIRPRSINQEETTMTI